MKTLHASVFSVLAATILAATAATRAFADAPYQATGLKICEVDAGSAIIWTRLTQTAKRVGLDGPRPVILYDGKPRTHNDDNRPDLPATVQLPVGASVQTLEGAAPGASGQTRVAYRAKGEPGWAHTSWAEVDPLRDFTHQHRLSGLAAATPYDLRVESRAGPDAPVANVLEGKFRTAPAPDAAQAVRFTVVTGQNYYSRDLPTEGWKIFGQMLSRRPDFFVHTGDILYYDQWAKSAALARWMWQQSFSLPSSANFYRHVPAYFMKDDHDTWMNDAYPTMRTRFMGEFTFAQGQAIFLEQVGMGEKTYRTIRWGRDLQIWLVEGRDFRSANDDPDGPGKTIWGAEQKAWFKRTVLESDATFRVLISPTPLVGPDRVTKNDSHANQGFTSEGDELRAFCAAQKNLVVVCGDRHWQYVSVDAKTGLREYSTGPTTNAHAGGWPKDRKEPEQRYVNVVGGFLEATVARLAGKPSLTFRHFSVDGKLLNEDVLNPQ